jgi:hypothetical protein
MDPGLLPFRVIVITFQTAGRQFVSYLQPARATLVGEIGQRGFPP